MKNFISAQELLSEKNSPLLIDCRFDLTDPQKGALQYQAGHLRGAFYMDLEKDLSGSLQLHGGGHPLPEMQGFQEKLRALGIDPESEVVVYDDSLLVAPRLWWMLKEAGVERVKILDGGYQAALEVHYPVTKEIPKVKTNNLSFPKRKFSVLSFEEVQELVDKPPSGTVLIDSREPFRYLGQQETRYKVAGTIPGAHNYFFKNVYQENRLQDLQTLREYFSPLQGKSQIVVFCGSGVTALSNIAAMEEVGLRALLYAGSYSDYISYVESEVEPGSVVRSLPPQKERQEDLGREEK